MCVPYSVVLDFQGRRVNILRWSITTETSKFPYCWNPVWDGPFLLPPSQSLLQILLSEVRVTASQTIDLAWDQPHGYRDQHGLGLLTRKFNFDRAAPQSLTRVPYEYCLSVAHLLPVAAEFWSSFSHVVLPKSTLLPEVSGRLELSLNDHGTGERCLRRLEESKLFPESEHFCSSF